MMGRTLIGAIALSLAATAWAPALADTKAGVDAWNRGDYVGAVTEWRKAAIAGDPDAQFNLGQAYKLGRGVPVDLAMAEGWYRKAAAQGHPQAIDNYGLALFQDGKRTEAVPWLEKSVARGEPRAQLVLGTMLFNGDGIQRDWVRAYALMVRSSAAGLPQGSQTLADMDKLIPEDQRRQGLQLARTYEEQAARPALGGELASGDMPPPTIYRPAPDRGHGRGRPSGAPTIATIDVPPSADTGPIYAPPAPPAPPPPKAPRPGKAKPVVVADAAPPKPAPVVAKATLPRAQPVATGGNWRVQLGAFKDEGNARALWERLRAQLPAMASYQPYLRHVGPLTKLQAGPVRSKADAERLCQSVARTGTPCVPVAP
ncbi:MAG: SPOR domain-containing protein [Sphingomonas sp.]|uniref:SPOR domain-containing protein n=1 Tax=Sphingomonas sp. TaxID=28214 RepID=UPI001AC1C1EC|nr:SPOR domain-containing protein [Sphingomonas sp.]MBN8807614.1 SPOR domain-containing protein [Sphingomonas sp.]